MPTKTRLISLGRRDIPICDHTATIGITTFAALHKNYFRGRKADAVKSTLRRLQRAQLLVARPLLGKQVFYQLTPKSCRLIGVPRELARPVGPQSRPEKYSLLWFTCIEPLHPRTLFNPGANEHFSVLPQDLRRVNFYLEERETETVMGLIVLDLGASTRRIFGKLTNRLRKYIDDGWLDNVIRTHAFEVTILTTSETKKADILSSLQPRLAEYLGVSLARIFGQVPEHFPIVIHAKVVPGLDRLLLCPQVRNKDNRHD